MIQQQNTPKSHHVRTFFASILGTIGVGLILSSVVVVWLNHTLTDTKAFTTMVNPLIEKPDVQNFITQKVSDQLLSDAAPQDIAGALLPADQIAGKTDDQLKSAIQPIITANILKIVQSPQTTALWKSTTQSAHDQFIAGLEADSSTLSLDLSPAINGVLGQLKDTELAPLSTSITPKPDTGKLNLKGGSFEKVHSAYKAFKTATVAIVILALLALGGSIALSVHHVKTTRRILLLVGIGSLLTALMLQIPSFIKLGDDKAETKLALVIARTLFHSLQLYSLILGCVCIALVLLTKFVLPKLTSRSATNARR